MSKYIVSIFILITTIIFISCTEHGTNIQKLDAPVPESIILSAPNELQISWQNPDNENLLLVNIDRKIGENEWEISYRIFPGDIEAYTDSVLLDPGVVISYRLKAFTEDDSSDISDVIAYFDSITTPTNLSVRQIDENQVILKWSDNSIGEKCFTIDRKIGENEWQLDYLSVDANKTETTINTVASDSVYFRVSATTGISNSIHSSIVGIRIFDTLSLENLYFGDDNFFDIMTWNVQNFPRLDDKTVDSLARAINALQVDIIAFQEIESVSDFNALLDSLDGYDGFRANSAYGDIDLAYIYNTNSVEVDTIYEIFKYENAFPRRPLVMQCKWHGYPLIIIDNHYKAYDDTESRERRYSASVMLVDYIQTYFESDNVIVLGDFNDEVTDAYSTNVFQPFIDLPNEFKIADMSIAQGSSTKWSYPTYPSHIDHIIISNELFDEFQQESTEIMTLLIDNYFRTGWNSYALSISDHRPVGLKLKL